MNITYSNQPITKLRYFAGLLHRLFLVLSVVITIVGIPTSTVLADPATLQAQSVCAPVPDMLYAVNVTDITSEIWIINPETREVLCHASTDINKFVDSINDIAFYQNNPVPFDQNSLYGVTFSNRFIRIDPNNWNVSVIKDIGIGILDALAFREDGAAYSSEYESTSSPGSWLIKIDTTTGEWTYLTTPLVPVYPDVYSTDDLAFREDGVLFASIRRHFYDNSWLVFVNRNTGGATLIGDIGYPNVTGLSFRHGFLYGLTQDGELLEINPSNGNGTGIMTISAQPPVSFRGLATHVKTGDANGDGKVDGLDYVIWLNNYYKSTSNGPSAGDFNNNGFVDGLDYVIWLNNYYKW